MDPRMKEFYQSMTKWLAEGMPIENLHGYSRAVALCGNLSQYIRFLYPDVVPHILLGWRDELRWAFVEAGLNRDFPFDGSGGQHFSCTDYYLNAQRLQWIYNHAAI